MDIVRNISAVEKLKCTLLSDIARLYESMSVPGQPQSEKKEIAASIIITVYLLSTKLGISFEEISNKVVESLKADILRESPLSKDKSMLCKYLSKKI